MYPKKRMRTVIITGSKIKKVLVLVGVFCFAGILFTISNAVSEISGPSGEAGIKIISDSINDNILFAGI